MSYELKQESLRLRAIQILQEYENHLRETECEGDFMQYVLPLVTDPIDKNWINPFSNYLLTQKLLKVIAKPKIQSALMGELSEDDMEEFIELLDNMTAFLRAAQGDQMGALLERSQIEIYGLNENTEHVVEETLRKSKSLRPLKETTLQS